MGFCQKNGHSLTFSLASATRFWIFTQFGGSTNNKRRVEINLGAGGGSTVHVDCGTHPSGHVEVRDHDGSNVISEIHLFHGIITCTDPGEVSTPLQNGTELVHNEADDIKLSSWEFEVPGTGDTVGITVIIVNNIATDP